MARGRRLAASPRPCLPSPFHQGGCSCALPAPLAAQASKPREHRLLVVLGGDKGQGFGSDVARCRRRRADVASPKAPALPAPRLPTLLQLPDSRCCCEPRLVAAPRSKTRLKFCRWMEALGCSLTHPPWLAAEGLPVMSATRGSLSPPFQPPVPNPTAFLRGGRVRRTQVHQLLLEGAGWLSCFCKA